MLNVQCPMFYVHCNYYTIEFHSKVLSLDNKNKKIFIYFVFYSLIRTFAR